MPPEWTHANFKSGSSVHVALCPPTYSDDSLLSLSASHVLAATYTVVMTHFYLSVLVTA